MFKETARRLGIDPDIRLAGGTERLLTSGPTGGDYERKLINGGRAMRRLTHEAAVLAHG